VAKSKEKYNRINLLIVEGNLTEAESELAAMASVIVEAPDSVEAGEYFYLLAEVGFNKKPHTEVLEIAYKAYQIVSETAENLLIGHIQALIGKIHVALGDLKTGEEFIRDAISSFRRINCEKELVLCYNKLGQVYFVRGKFRQAEKFLNRAIEILDKDEQAPPALLIKARGNYARVQILLGEWRDALPVLEDCVEFCRQNRINVSLAKNLLSLGYVKYLSDDFAAARQLYQEAFTLIVAEEMIRDRSIYHEYMGDLLLALGDLQMARQHYNYAIEIGNRIAPQSAIISQTERRLAELELGCSNHAKAREHAIRAQKVAELVGEQVEIAATTKVLATLAATDGDLSIAAKLYSESISVFETCGCLREQAMALLLAGRTMLVSEELRAIAARYLDTAVSLADRLQLPRLKAECFYQISRLEIKSGDFDAALNKLRVCEVLASELGQDTLLEECRVLRLNIEDELIDCSLSSENQFMLFSSFLTTTEYDHLKSGNLEENLEILQNKVNADRVFVLVLDENNRAYELLAAIHFQSRALDKIASSLGNGRGGSIPLDRPLFVSRFDNERIKTFDYIADPTQPISTLITVPIKLADDAPGVLYLDRIGVNAVPFSKSDLYFAIAFSDIVAFKSSEEQKRRLSRDNKRLKSQLQQQLAFPNIITTNREMLDILDRVAQVKDSPISILIEGETGTGKDYLAKAIHYNSNRKEKQFVSVNCAALPETLLESELFGHKRGAFTGAECDKIGLFEEAGEGTFFLDEIGDMPLSVQVKLLRVIEEKELVRLGETTPRQIDVRIISATNCDLHKTMEEGRFRQDLYYRLSTFAFCLPPLRERREDIPLLIKHFLAKTDSDVAIEPEASRYLCDYNWLGNIRELENEIRKMELLAGDSKYIGKQLISRRIVDDWSESSNSSPAEDGSFSLYDHIARLERQFILKALDQNKWVKKHAAVSLSIPESTLRLKMKQYSIAKS